MGGDAGLSWLAHPTPREGQLEMISACLETLAKGGAHLASAPTGIGKTAAALAAAFAQAAGSRQQAAQEDQRLGSGAGAGDASQRVSFITTILITSYLKLDDFTDS